MKRASSAGRPVVGPGVRAVAGALACLGAWAAPAATPEPDRPCRIEVVEQGTGWPVPLVELRTTHQVRFVTDNAGVIAFDLPELMGRETWFDVVGHGYEIAADGFGLRGARLTPEPGAVRRVEVRRTIAARRLGRLTGAGRFGESQRTGQERDWRDGDVLGCDSVQNAVHRGRFYWFWGDTTVARYPLGIFDSTGATTPVRALEVFEPPLRLRYELFSDEGGAPRAVAKLPGDGPTWLTACVSLPDHSGAARLGATYLKIKLPLEAYERGLCLWNDAEARFEALRVVWRKSASAPEAPPMPDGHAVAWRDEGGREWMVFGNPLPALRCPATFEAWQDPSTWEILKPQATLAPAAGGDAIKPHSGSIAWNPWRRRWVTVFVQHFGRPSAFGEVWYAEADAPTGPWGPAVKVLTHEQQTFYNPRLHSEFTPGTSPILLFEGTYTRQFTDHAPPTPRHEYNQILYRLDLDDPALAPAQARR